MKALAILLAGLVLLALLGDGESFGVAASSTTQTVSGGGVTAKVTVLTSKGADDVRFQVVLDTHSVNLDAYDLNSIAVLRDDTGKTYVPTAIEKKGGGHHRDAVVTFAKRARS